MSILILNSILFYRKSQEQDFKRMTNAVFFLKTQRFRYILLAKKDQKKNQTRLFTYFLYIPSKMTVYVKIFHCTCIYKKQSPNKPNKPY